mmetsp:Transcript_8194/g.5847  ORF Transcript_8194/g.5847 Transcript_8194/m.5847 type:complete len:247 (-) Transcript_8194:17-757(-)
MSSTPCGGLARNARMAALTLSRGTVALSVAAVKPLASANGMKLSITQRIALKPVSSRLSSAVRSAVRENLRSSHASEILRWHSGVKAKASLNTGLPTLSGSMSWLTPDWSSVPTPQVKNTGRPSSCALTGNSLFRMVIEYCSGWSSFRNCSAVLVGSSFVTYTIAGISQARSTSRISTRPLTLSTASAKLVRKKRETASCGTGMPSWKEARAASVEVCSWLPHSQPAVQQPQSPGTWHAASRSKRL